MNILVLCTGNSARSILLESILAQSGLVTSFSAGSKPTGRVNPAAIALLDKLGHDTSGFKSQSWEDFATPDAPHMDVVITVCGSAAGEVCPIWPGTPLRAHWGVEDPADATGDAIAPAFETAYAILNRRAAHFLNAPIEEMDQPALQAHLTNCGNIA